ncbi:WD40-repeat-containing domain protein [Daedaleopsis nitida]|nr:WD40-repeat-containing domain protein [Daedaleopsis nitida]
MSTSMTIVIDESPSEDSEVEFMGFEPQVNPSRSMSTIASLAGRQSEPIEVSDDSEKEVEVISTTKVPTAVTAESRFRSASAPDDADNLIDRCECVQEDVDTHLLDRIVALSRRTCWVLDSMCSEQPQFFYAKLDRALSRPGPLLSPSLAHSTSTRHGHCDLRSCHSTVCKLDLWRTVYEAPGDVNTIIQSGNLVICASAISDGSFNDIPGPYNRDGSLGLWDGKHAQILKGHHAIAVRDPVFPQEHYFTVNDVTMDPTRSTRFASAGRDKKVLIWEHDAPEDEPKILHSITCEDNPEVIKYQPGSYVLAVQCDNGTVCILRGGRLCYNLQVAPPHKNHVTADIHWGTGLADGYLFASSAGTSNPAGYHKAFDVEQQRVVMEFDAKEEACSTSTLDCLGATLYIATEGSDCQYILRAFDVRRRGSDARTAVHQIALEPFKGDPSHDDTDINCLSVSSDGLYIAVARTDNCVDVYDARKLSRGPLYKLAHDEREDGRNGIHSYGVVKVQWVDGLPHGTGFVSGGIDGCVRLWDVKRASEDPYNGRVLARCVDDVATFSLGNLDYDEAPIVVGERSGKVSIFGFAREEDASS